ncbi:16S rRNA (guanine527-N7)-methyltransferase [Melghirimyces profundicolus]|uniref:Ribosomal RNA small subunit methyltransferase G n=1 Tax=Melghirimyces profundicolus TaxID=1242148 RepID=A0A2T6C291_9BACL|nr:16S rRNA (guanine(527)-N(7))-methyltransferase RsmG [Melghirimyces profundicolus]PTX62413.1 16S rRNA (guanine527-N7)-methyltransferase [Melghirimyces profundicolus]
MECRDWLGEQVRVGLGLELSGEQLDRFSLYFRLLVEGNQKLNLTTITKESEVFIKHFYDSLTVAGHLPLTSMETVIDVGTGAGFPGLPLKIAFPHLRLVLLDSLNKRVTFLKETTEQLGLKGVQYLHARAEEAARNRSHREAYDLAAARAVAKLNVLSEYCLPFVRRGGWFVAMKGPDVSEEMQESERAIQVLGGTPVETVSLSLPENQGKRNLILIQKKSPTPKTYPRKAGTPLRKPVK